MLIALVVTGCSKHTTLPGGAVVSGGSHTDAGMAGAAKGGAGAKNGADAGRVTQTDGGISKDSGTKARNPDAGHLGRDAGASAGCGGLTCPAPTTCDATGAAPICMCPAGYVFVDLGGQNPPCFPKDACPDCDGG